jgi:hypothetical protein
MAKKSKDLSKRKKATDKQKKTFGKPVDVTGVSGGSFSSGADQPSKAIDKSTPLLYH